MTLLALYSSAKINVASPRTINLKPSQTIHSPPPNQKKKPNNNKKEKHSTGRGKTCEQPYFHRRLLSNLLGEES